MPHYMGNAEKMQRICEGPGSAVAGLHRASHHGHCGYPRRGPAAEVRPRAPCARHPARHPAATWNAPGAAATSGKISDCFFTYELCFNRAIAWADGQCDFRLEA